MALVCAARCFSCVPPNNVRNVVKRFPVSARGGAFTYRCEVSVASTASNGVEMAFYIK